MKRTFALVLVFLSLPAFGRPIPKALADLVAAERNFSETCRQKGIRNSFLEFFADDVVTFDPELRKGKAGLQSIAAEPNGPTLQWEPVYGDISIGGDLGYTTGPYIYTSRTGAMHYGMFFSVWKRQPDGTFKVVLDAGLPAPKMDGSASREFRAAPRLRYAKGVRFDPISGSDELMEAERRFSETAEQQGMPAAVLLYGASSLRLHRTGSLPILGLQKASTYIRQHPHWYRSKALGSGVSSSGDLAFVYGTFEGKSGTADRGYYVRIWRRNEHGDWRVALDSMHPVRKHGN